MAMALSSDPRGPASSTGVEGPAPACFTRATASAGEDRSSMGTLTERRGGLVMCWRDEGCDHGDGKGSWQWMAAVVTRDVDTVAYLIVVVAGGAEIDEFVFGVVEEALAGFDVDGRESAAGGAGSGGGRVQDGGENEGSCGTNIHGTRECGKRRGDYVDLNIWILFM